MCYRSKNKKGVEDMAKVAPVNYPKSRESKIDKSVREVELIESGKLSRKTAREFLKESSNK